ncbi:MAG: RING-H2 finger protein [Propionibacteriaceae bacterium]|nr:MAG: RING-H2 finger protein [Propionibacteriaceae bacterium]
MGAAQHDRMRRAARVDCPFEVTFARTAGHPTTLTIRGETGHYDAGLDTGPAPHIVCGCPDAARAPALLCKHACWLLLRVAGHLHAPTFARPDRPDLARGVERLVLALRATGVEALREEMAGVRRGWDREQEHVALSESRWHVAQLLVRERDWGETEFAAARAMQAAHRERRERPARPERQDAVPAPRDPGDPDDDCPICFAPYGDARCVRCTACPGTFHRACAATWGRSCPLCRDRDQFADLAPEAAPAAGGSAPPGGGVGESEGPRSGPAPSESSEDHSSDHDFADDPDLPSFGFP